jgi:hypothetical protein
MAKILFISEDYVKENTTINENVDVKLLRSTIWDCQRDYIKPILGTDLYNKVESEINAGTLTGNYQTLVDTYISESLIKWVMMESVPTMLYKYRNKSVSTQTSDNASPISYQAMQQEMNRWRDKAELRSQDITRYLCANDDLFPEYCSNEDSDDIQPSGSNYTTSIYLG